MPLSAYKKEARTCLKKRKLRAFRITMSMRALAVLLAVAGYSLPQFVSIAADPYLLAFSQAALFLLSFMLSGALRQGRTAWLYCIACGREPSSVQFLYWMRMGRGLRAAALYMRIRVRKLLWTAALSAPGICVLAAGVLYAGRMTPLIAWFVWVGGAVSLAVGLVFAALICQKYALAPILFARSAYKGVRSAVRGSCFLMEDDCARLLLLKLSFAPWWAACVTLLPAVYVIPYYQQATTCMLRRVLRAHTL